MLIDLIYIVIVILAIFRGISKGLVLGIFSLLAFIIGLAAALKLSVVVANYLGNSVVSATKWLPLLSFILVFLVVVLVVSLLARLIKKALQLALLGWLDGLGGVILYIIIYTIIFSIFLFYAEKLLLLQHAEIISSKTYPYISPWGPKVIDNLGKIIPVFKDMFSQLENFFESLAKRTA